MDLSWTKTCLYNMIEILYFEDILLFIAQSNQHTFYLSHFIFLFIHVTVINFALEQNIVKCKMYLLHV